MAAVSATGPLTVGDVLPLLEEARIHAMAVADRAEAYPDDAALRSAATGLEHRLGDLVMALRDMSPSCDGRCRREAPRG